MKQAVVSKVAVVTVGRIGFWNVVTMNCAVSESLVRINCGSFLCQFGRCRSKCTNDRKKRMANIVDRQLVKCNCDGSSCCVVRSSQRKFCVYVCDSHSHSQGFFFGVVGVPTTVIWVTCRHSERCTCRRCQLQRLTRLSSLIK